MGQYLEKRKIGTCENMYYLRLDEAKEYAEQGRCDDDGISFKSYLEDNQTRFRFPWPCEDDQSFERDSGKREYSKSFDIPCPVEVGHKEICIHNTLKGGGYGINLFLPCPYSTEANYQISSGGAGVQFVDICFQAIRYGKEKTLFQCSRCGKLQRFSDEDIEKIKARAVEHYSVYKRDEAGYSHGGGNKSLYEYAMKVIERIR